MNSLLGASALDSLNIFEEICKNMKPRLFNYFLHIVCHGVSAGSCLLFTSCWFRYLSQTAVLSPLELPAEIGVAPPLKTSAHFSRKCHWQSSLDMVKDLLYDRQNMPAYPVATCFLHGGVPRRILRTAQDYILPDAFQNRIPVLSSTTRPCAIRFTRRWLISLTRPGAPLSLPSSQRIRSAFPQCLPY